MPPPARANTRVIKTLSMHQPGAAKLAHKYGSALVCVRYRHDAAGQIRYTTVELVVDEAPIRKRKPNTEIVLLMIERHETQLQRLVREHGARWDPHARAWRLPIATARRLKLLHRAIAN